MTATSLLSRAETISDVDVSVFKLVAFVAATAIAAAVCGYSIAVAVTPWGLFWEMLAITFFCLLFALHSFFIKSRLRALGAIAIESFAMLMPIIIIFRNNFSVYFLWAFIALMVILYYGYDSGRHELKNAIKIPFWRVAHRNLAKAIPGVLTLIFIVYVFIAQSVAAQNGDLVIQYFVAPVIKPSVPDFNSQMSVNDILGKIADKQGITEPQKSASIANVDKMIDSYEFKTKEPLGQATYDFFATKLNSPSFSTRLYFLIALIGLLWIVIKTIALILYLPVEFLALMVYEILVVTNFASVQYESRSREIIILK